MTQVIRLESISQVHQMLNLDKPKHPLISVFQHQNSEFADFKDINIISDFYIVSFKGDVSGSVNYGRQSYDFQEGTLLFFAPQQVMSVEYEGFHSDPKGWTLIFHPDLIRPFDLAKKMASYSFFSYEINEALHISDDELQLLTQLVDKIKLEIGQNTDQHTHNLMAANLGLLLDYCNRYFDRQFYTRTHVNQQVVSRFEQLLQRYYQRLHHLEQGIPSVAFCAGQLNLSANYLSDLLKKETGQSAIEHIHAFVIDKAKTELLQHQQAVGQLAYDLGFDYPSHFSKLFKQHTGMSPSEFRKTH